MSPNGNMVYRFRSVQLFALASLIFVFGFLFGTQTTALLADHTRMTAEQEAQFEPLFQTFELIQDRYVEDVPVDDLVNGAIRGMVESLDDPYSAYVDPEFYEFVDNDLSGEIEGIGVVITRSEENDWIEIVNVLDGTPAESSGLLPGDVFYAVDGEEVIGLNNLELAARVRGPAGSTVVLTMQRGEDLVEFTVERARIVVPNVETDILPGNIAYVSMEQFSSSSRDQVLEAFDDVNIDQRNGLIFDLRGNPGGFLSSAVEIGSLFQEEGILLIEQFADGDKDVFEVRDGRVYRTDINGVESVYSNDAAFADIDVPIVVLVDSGSASASELVAGAWQDNDAVTIIGDVTFGKGTVQIQNELSNGGGVRLTIARWLTPNGQWITDVGITPDILVELPEDALFNDDDDVILKAALEYFETLVTEPSLTP